MRSGSPGRHMPTTWWLFFFSGDLFVAGFTHNCTLLKHLNSKMSYIDIPTLQLILSSVEITAH